MRLKGNIWEYGNTYEPNKRPQGLSQNVEDSRVFGNQ